MIKHVLIFHLISKQIVLIEFLPYLEMIANLFNRVCSSFTAGYCLKMVHLYFFKLINNCPHRSRFISNFEGISDGFRAGRRADE